MLMTAPERRVVDRGREDTLKRISIKVRAPGVFRKLSNHAPTAHGKAHLVVSPFDLTLRLCGFARENFSRKGARTHKTEGAVDSPQRKISRCLSNDPRGLDCVSMFGGL